MCCGDERCPDHLCPGHPRMAGVPLHQADGGHVFRGGVVFPIAEEADDQSLYTPESVAAPMPRAMRIVIATFIAVAMAIAGGVLDPLITNLKP